MAWSTPRTWVAGEIPTDGTFNTHLRDQFNALTAPLQSYATTGAGYTTFAWTASTTNPAIGNGTITARFGMLGGKEINFRILIVFGSTTSVGSGTYFFRLPLTPNLTGNESVDGTTVLWSGSARKVGIAVTAPAADGTILLIASDTAAGVNNSTPYAWAAGASISISGSYEAA